MKLKFKMPKVKVPKVKVLKVKAPKVKVQKVKVLKVKAPKVKTPKVEVPKGKVPKIKVPRIRAPEIKATKIKMPRNRKKETILALAIIVAGNLGGGALLILENGEAGTQALPRKEYGEGDYSQTLQVYTEEGSQQVEILVKERQYTSKEIYDFLRVGEEALDAWMEEQEGDTGVIRQDLELPQSLPENPVKLSYQTNKPELMSWDGTLGEGIPQTGEQVELTCHMELGGEEKVWHHTVTVCPAPLSQTGKLQQEIQQQAEKLSGDTSETLLLPDRLESGPVAYKRQTSGRGWMICLLSLAAGLGIYPLKKEKEKEDQEKRNRQLQADYPDIIQKLILFLKAGLSIRSSMEKLAFDYLQARKYWNMKERCAYEEVVKTCNEMAGGIYEAEAYERLGKRCLLSEYKVLSVLLVQNLKKGNQSILELLEREAAAAGQERLRRAKVRGEEASTKLLLPMIMQLVVVLIILMVPAFMSFF